MGAAGILHGLAEKRPGAQLLIVKITVKVNVFSVLGAHLLEM
jgi:hypothetical protein